MQMINNMKQKNTILQVSSMVILLVLLSVGCSREDNSIIKCDDSQEDLSKTIPVDEAIASLEQLMTELYGETKSSKNYSIDVFGGINTKADDFALPDSTLYLVNFGEKDGYAILSAQTRIKTGIFCITESGTITPHDIQEAIANMEKEDVTKATEDGDEEDDDCFIDLGREIVPAIIASSLINQWYYGYESCEETEDTKANSYTGTPDTSAMLETKWHQGSPFNDFRSDSAPAGCVAVATAQIIEFNAINYGYTSFVKDNYKTFDWNLLRTVCHCTSRFNSGTVLAQQEASDFLEYVGLAKNCNISYDVNGSGGYADGAKRTFKNMGYKSVKKYLGFETADKNRAIAQLTNGFPMFMSGLRSGGGHAWVLDGIYVRKVYNEVGSYLRTESMFHINWGWRGQDDGYFLQGVFDTSQRQDTETGVDPGTSSTPSRNYTWNYRTITYSL